MLVAMYTLIVMIFPDHHEDIINEDKGREHLLDACMVTTLKAPKRDCRREKESCASIHGGAQSLIKTRTETASQFVPVARTV